MSIDKESVKLWLLVLAAAILAYVALSLITEARASGDNITINNNITNHYGGGNGNGNGMSDMKTSLERDVSRAVATASALSFCQFDHSPKLQGCVGTATFDDEWALNFQVGKTVDTMLFVGGFSCDDEFEECAAGGAVNFKFQ